MGNKTITIFGSSIPLPGEIEYEDAYYIGKALAKEGFNICSGGSMGIMDVIKELKSNFKEISEKCHKYTKKEYQINKIAEKIKKYHADALLTIDSFNKLSVIKMIKFYRKIGIK